MKVLLLLHLAVAFKAAFDIGTRTFKAAELKNGRLEMKTKGKGIMSCIQIRDETKVFGDDAISTISLFPKSTICDILRLVGRSATSPEAIDYAKTTGLNVYEEDGLRIRVSENESYSSVELLSLFMQHLKNKISTRQIVLVVPHYFDQFQRQMMLDAAEVVGFEATLVNDFTAAAFSLHSAPPTPRVIAIVQFGHRASGAALVTYHKDKRMEIKSSFNPNFTCISMEEKLADFLEKKYLSANPNEQLCCRNSFLSAATKAKEHLSLTKTTTVVINLKTEYETEVTIQDIQLILNDFKNEVMSPLKNVLPIDENGNLMKIDALYSLGGCSLIPDFKKWVSSMIGIDVQTTIHPFDGTSMGGILFGRKQKEVKLIDSLPYSIFVNGAVLFENTLLNSTKTVEFALDGKTNSEFIFTTLLNRKLGNLTLFTAVPEGRSASFTVLLDMNGILSIQNASIMVEKAGFIASSIVKEDLNYKFELGYPKLTKNKTQKYKKTLELWAERDLKVKRYGSALNALESNILTIPDLLESIEYENLISLSDRTDLLTLVQQAKLWLKEKKQTIEDMQTKNAQLEDKKAQMSLKVFTYKDKIRQIRTLNSVLNLNVDFEGYNMSKINQVLSLLQQKQQEKTIREKERLEKEQLELKQKMEQIKLNLTQKQDL